MTLKELQAEAHRIAVAKGWWDNEPPGGRNVGEMLMLCVTVLAEAMEELRTGGHTPISEVYYIDDKPEGFAVELADVLIRAFDLAESFGIDLERAVRLKMAYNETRPYRHGGKRA